VGVERAFSEQICELIHVLRGLPHIKLVREESSDPDEKRTDEGCCNVGVVDRKDEVPSVGVAARKEGERKSAREIKRNGGGITHGARQISRAA